MQDGSHCDLQGYERRVPGRPKGSKDTAPRRCRVLSSKIVDSRTEPTSLDGVLFHPYMSESSTDASYSMHQFMLMDNSSAGLLASCGDWPADLNSHPWESCGVASESRSTQGSSSSMRHPWTHDIGRGECSATPSGEASREPMDDDPFHYDWPYW